MNFSPNDYADYRVGVPPRRQYVPVFTTDAPEFGGSGFTPVKTPVAVESVPSHGRPHSALLKIPAFGAVFLRGEGQLPEKPQKKAASHAAAAQKSKC